MTDGEGVESGMPELGRRAHAGGSYAAVLSVAFNSDGTVSPQPAGQDGEVWDANTGRALHTLRGHNAAVLSVAFNPDGTRLATASATRR